MFENLKNGDLVIVRGVVVETDKSANPTATGDRLGIVSVKKNRHYVIIRGENFSCKTQTLEEKHNPKVLRHGVTIQDLDSISPFAERIIFGLVDSMAKYMAKKK